MKLQLLLLCRSSASVFSKDSAAGLRSEAADDLLPTEKW